MLPSLESPNQIEPSADILEAAARLLAAIGAGGRARRKTLLGRLSQLQQRKLRELGIDLGNSELTTRQYNAAMAEEIEAEHTAAAAIFRGSLEGLTSGDARVIRGRVNSELGFLSGLVIGWVGNNVTQGKLASRSQMYGAAVRPTYYAVGIPALESEGFTLERNLLSPVDNCEGVGSCVQETAKGFVTIDTLIPIGDRVCLSFCQCEIETVNVSSNARVVL